EMKHLTTVLAAAAIAVPQAASAQDSPSVTLFSNGRTLVRRMVPISIPAGISTHPVEFGVFDPSSFAVLEPGVVLERLTFDAQFDENAILRRSIGDTFDISLGMEKQVIRARLVGINPERWELIGGVHEGLRNGVMFGRPGQIVWREGQVPTGPVADAVFRAERARNSVRVMYETMGGNWNADYRLFLGSNARFEGTATIAAGVLDIDNAEVQLLAGDIGQKAAPPMPRDAAYARMAVQEMSLMSEAEAVGEVRLYTVPGRVKFTPGVITTLPLFESTPVQPELRLIVPGAVPFWGGLSQFGDEQEVPVEVRYRFDRKLGTTFGDLPLPAGTVSVYDTDRAGRVQLVGAGQIGHTSAGEMMEVSTGSAFDVTARRTQVSYTTSVVDAPRRTTATAEYRVVVKNAKEVPVKVEVREDRGGDWSVVTSSVEPVRLSSSRVVFPLTVPARGEATVTYRVRVVW
ncbi:MAG TPA: hypothetical protein PLL69_01860, partial [Gemmatimonadales bacterium]|nr:hypothetical protein [Gemmatimonadales bacterium]